MDIKTIFSEIIKSKTDVQFSEEEINSMASDFLLVATYKIISAVEKKMNQDEFENVKKLLEGKDLAGAFKYIEMKLAESAMKELIDNEMMPLLDDYFETVFKK